MRTEPTLIIEAVRILAVLAGMAGLVITADEQAALVAGIGAVIGLVSVILAIVNRSRVFSPRAAETLVSQAVVAGRSGTTPPAVNPPGK